MRELSVFVDESGDFGTYDPKSPFYIIGMVFHDQHHDIKEEISKLEKELSNIGWGEHCVHAGPIIRSENEYDGWQIEERRRIFKRITAFTRNLDIGVKTFYIEKRKAEDSIEAAGMLSKQISVFIRSKYELFMEFDTIKVYYDNGQIEVTRILSSVFNALLDNVEFKKVIPAGYRLFQVADLVCTLKLTELKMINHIMSRSEKTFFEDERTLKKKYLKIISEKEW